MPYYVVLANYTDQGVKAIRGAPERIKGASELVASLGGRFVDIYYTLGQYDFVAICEFPDDETMLSVAMRIGMDGNLRFTTMKAIPKEEAIRVIQALP